MREVIVRNLTQRHARQLLHNKFVVVLGDSIQRSVYKDLVLLLQRDSYLTMSQLKNKGELSFEQDCLVEGGRLSHMTNGTEYREVRQYRSDHHLVRFYFITRIFSSYMESILADFQHDLTPDVVIVNSCVWDVSRYNRKWAPDYMENLNKFFERLNAFLPSETLVVWNMTMPLGRKIIGGFLVPEIEHIGPALRYDVVEANFYGAMLADAYGLDVLDLHFMFRFSLHHRMKDGVHWNALVHRQISCLLLAHIAQAWGVDLPNPTTNVLRECVQRQKQQQQHAAAHSDHNKMGMLAHTQSSQQSYSRSTSSWVNPDQYGGPNQRWTCSNQYIESSYAVWQQMPPYDGFGPYFYEDGLPLNHQFSGGFFNFQDLQQRNMTNNGKGHFYNVWSGVANLDDPRPLPDVKNVSAAPSWPANNMVMKQKHTRRQYTPYTRQKPKSVYRL